MTTMNMRAEHRQSQTLSPRLQHAVRLLQMSSQDFAAMVRDTMGKNPFLDGEDSEDGGRPDSAANGGVAAADPAARAFDNSDMFDAGAFDADTGSHTGDLRADAISQGDQGGDVGNDASGADIDAGDASDRDLWSADSGSGTRSGDDGGELSALDLMAVETSLASHLHGQLNVLPLAPRDAVLASAIVDSLDDDGYLRSLLEELIDVVNLDPPATLKEMQIALRRVQSMDPAGVGARTVGECLQLQLPAIDCPDVRALAKTIVDNHLRLLAARDINGLARALGQTPARIEAVCDRIRRLDPRPGWRFGSSQVAYVVPDVIVRKVRGEWRVQLNPAVVPKVRLNSVYEQLFQNHRSARNVEMGAQLNEARWTVRNVQQRFTTIFDVAQAIVRRQKNFLEYGSMAMKPLGLKQIADEVGVHESTVSRVTNNKFMATPVGVFELKYFFSRAMPTASGGVCSGIALRGLIKDIVDAENPDEPLSDAEIARQFSQQGLVVARRTVTKYRQMLKIEAVERRRRHACAAVRLYSGVGAVEAGNVVAG